MSIEKVCLIYCAWSQEEGDIKHQAANMLTAFNMFITYGWMLNVVELCLSVLAHGSRWYSTGTWHAHSLLDTIHSDLMFPWRRECCHNRICLHAQRLGDMHPCWLACIITSEHAVLLLYPWSYSRMHAWDLTYPIAICSCMNCCEMRSYHHMFHNIACLVWDAYHAC